MKQYIVIPSHAEKQKILFEGVFSSFVDCVETAVCQNVDLRYADLSYKNLTNGELDNGCFAYARFKGANLTGANLSEANCFGADFSCASLFNTCFAQSDLRHSRFDYASFGATDFSRCDISDAFFSGSSCFHQDFMHVKTMDRCVFGTHENELLFCSEPPIVVLGLKTHPIAFKSSDLPIQKLRQMSSVVS